MLEAPRAFAKQSFGNIFLRDEEAFMAVAWHGAPTYVNTCAAMH